MGVGAAEAVGGGWLGVAAGPDEAELLENWAIANQRLEDIPPLWNMMVMVKDIQEKSTFIPRTREILRTEEIPPL